MQTYKLPQLAWYDPKKLEVFFPDSWDIEVCNIAGYDKPALSKNQIRDIITNPIGMPPIREAAKNKKDVAIIFDDLTRVTRVSKILPYILSELALAGISASNIRFISATGSHGPLDRIDLAKKLGDDVLARYAVYNHNCFNNCEYVGTTSYGTEVRLNTEFISCDFKIAIGSSTPHPAAIFSGGGKMVLPGVAHFDCIAANHSLPITDEQASNYETNPRRLEKEEAAKMAELDMLVECIVNLWGESCSIHAGAESLTHDAAVEEARSHYLTPKAEEKDIVIANNYAKSSEAGVAIKTASQSAKKSGGNLVLIANAPGGQVPHYLLGIWGKKAQSRLTGLRPPTPHIQRLIRYNEYPDMATIGKAITMSNWQDTIDYLKKLHGEKAKVVIYPNAAIQYFC